MIPMGTLIAATPEFIRTFNDSLGMLSMLKVNTGGIVKHVGEFSTVVQFKPGETYAVPHWMALKMAEHERNLTQCLKLIDAYNRIGGFR